MAILTDGFTQTVDLGSSLAYVRNVAACTIMIWYSRRDDVPVNNPATVLNFGAGNTAVNLRVRLELQVGNPSLALRARALDTDSSSTLTSPDTYTSGIWRHLAGVVTFTSATGRLYVNGVLNTTGSFASMTAGNSANTNALLASIAGVDGATAFAGGLFADARIYHRALSANEILTIYNARGRDGIQDALQGRWMLNEQAINVASTTIVDLSANARNAFAKSSIVGITALYNDDMLSPRRRRRR